MHCALCCPVTVSVHCSELRNSELLNSELRNSMLRNSAVQVCADLRQGGSVSQQLLPLSAPASQLTLLCQKTYFVPLYL